MQDPRTKKRWQSSIGITIFTLFVLSSIVVNQSVQAMNQAAGNYGYYGGTYGYGGSTNTSRATSDQVPATVGSQAVAVGSGQVVVSWAEVTTTRTMGTTYDNHSAYRVVYNTTDNVTSAYTSNNGDAALPSGASVWTTANDSLMATRATIRTTITGLTNGTLYYFAVYACDTNVNCSNAPSAAVSGTPAAAAGGGGGGGGGTTGGTASGELVAVTPAVTAAPAAPSAAAPTAPASSEPTLANMTADAGTVVSGDGAAIAGSTGSAVNPTEETKWSAAITTLFGAIPDPKIRNPILYFVVYGTPTTRFLGSGERLGVVNSYRVAFSRLPSTVGHWNDIIKIGNGRWPGEFSTAAEVGAKTRFRTIYRRAANMSQPNDNACVTVMSYGLRPKPRNTNSEKTAIGFFKLIFGRSPVSATDWDAVRCIAYSGAKR